MNKNVNEQKCRRNRNVNESRKETSNQVRVIVSYGFDGLLGTASGAVNDSVYADQGSRNGFWFTVKEKEKTITL